MTFIFRPITCDDAVALQHLCWQHRPMNQIHDKLKRMVTDPLHERSFALVIAMDKQLIGYGEVGRWRQSAEIANLFIAEGWRSHGLGTLLIDKLRRYALKWHTPHLEIGVSQNNPHALRLYQRIGFTFAYSRTTEQDIVDYLRWATVTNGVGGTLDEV